MCSIAKIISDLEKSAIIADILIEEMKKTRGE